VKIFCFFLLAPNALPGLTLAQHYSTIQFFFMPIKTK
jgi:hypothetical protein